jgi:hypothetical protein
MNGVKKIFAYLAVTTKHQFVHECGIPIILMAKVTPEHGDRMDVCGTGNTFSFNCSSIANNHGC